MSHSRRFLSLPVLVFCLLVSAGCGGSQKGPVLKGTIVLPANVKMSENDSASINFAPNSEGAKQFSATVNPADLTFEASGSEGKGVVPGDYKITVILQPYVPGESPQRKVFDAINTRYDDGNSNLTCKVTNDPEQSITIDLSKGTVTKK